jgi:hypothetical protein
MAVDVQNNVYLCGEVGNIALQLGNNLSIIESPTFGYDGYIAKYKDIEFQDFDIDQGWNIISAYINPFDTSMTDVMADLGDTVLLMKDGLGGVYWPQYNVNQIGNWNIESGYLIKVSDITRFRLSGELVQPDSLSMVLDAGWHMISYPRYLPITVEDIFTQYAGSIVLIKDGNGQIYWPAWAINLIGEMLPGQGYQLKVSAGFVLEYPAN